MRVHEVVAWKFSFLFMLAFAGVVPQDGILAAGKADCKVDEEVKSPNASFVPLCLPKPSLHPCDNVGNPWPTIIVEVAKSKTVTHARNNVNFYLHSNRAEDVILFYLGKWEGCTDAAGQPLRYLLCEHYCHQRSPQHENQYQPFMTYEFGTVHPNGRKYNGCSAHGMQVLMIQ
ncbi:hypothetical protein BC937DRAFT_86282, partial [Endogone sp. FLAS-F59071]